MCNKKRESHCSQRMQELRISKAHAKKPCQIYFTKYVWWITMVSIKFSASFYHNGEVHFLFVLGTWSMEKAAEHSISHWTNILLEMCCFPNFLSPGLINLVREKMSTKILARQYDNQAICKLPESVCKMEITDLQC